MPSRLHSHVFDQGNPLAERRTRWAVGLTAAMMVAEIAGGWWYNSMALLADGWHMSSHALALGLSLLSYAAARRFARDPRFAFGTWKIETLGGFSSALLLLGVAALMLVQSAERLLNPGAIHYDQAIEVAVVGLLVNLLCAWLLHDGHDHHHDHGHNHHHHHHAGHDHAHHDLNQRAAFLHVVADAATSVLAIVALLAGKWWGAAWLDPFMGVVGAVLVASWARGLLVQSGRVLLDAEMDVPLVAAVRQTLLAAPGDAAVTDLHIWRVGRNRYACIVALEHDGSASTEDVHRLLSVHPELVHLTVELGRRWRKAVATPGITPAVRPGRIRR
jgi:cation diffusion facilitator family transporter